MFDSLVRWRNMQECRSEKTGALLEDLLERFKNMPTILTGQESIGEYKELSTKVDRSQGMYSRVSQKI